MKNILIIGILLLPLFLRAQAVDSLAYYESLFAKHDSVINLLCDKARNNRHGILGICIDSNFKPIAGMKIGLDSSWDITDTAWKGYPEKDSIIATGVTDLNGGYLFLHSAANVSVTTVSDSLKNFDYSGHYGEGDDDKPDIITDDDMILHWPSDREWRERRRWRLLYAAALASDRTLKDMPYLKLNNLVLTDSITKTKFILDTNQIYITAIDSNGKKLWHTDPWKDNHLMMYRYKRPIIVHFEIGWSKMTNNQDVILIRYDSSQFGIIDEATGKFTFYGQD